jgi:multiple sugar transport system permease protein
VISAPVTVGPSLRRRALRRAGEGRAAWLLVLPDVLGLCLIYVGPIFFTIYLSFFWWNGISPDRTFVGLDNYRYIFTDPVWLKSLGVSFAYLLMYVPLVTGGALFLAVLLSQKLRGTALFRTIFFLPMAVPVVVAAIVWQFIFQPSYGFVNFLLQSVGLPAQPWLSSPQQALGVVVLVSAWKQVGYFMIIFLAAILAVPKDFLEAASLDGAGSFRRFWSITWPTIRPTTAFVVVMTSIIALQDFDQIFVLTKGGPDYGTYVQVYYIYDQMLRYLHMGPASAASVVLFIIIMVLSIAQIRILRGGRDAD